MDNTTRNWLSVVVGSLVAVGVGVADAFVVHSAFGTSADLLFIVGGLAGLGVKVALDSPTSSEVQTLSDRVTNLEAKHNTP